MIGYMHVSAKQLLAREFQSVQSSWHFLVGDVHRLASYPDSLALVMSRARMTQAWNSNAGTGQD